VSFKVLASCPNSLESAVASRAREVASRQLAGVRHDGAQPPRNQPRQHRRNGNRRKNASGRAGQNLSANPGSPAG